MLQPKFQENVNQNKGSSSSKNVIIKKEMKFWFQMETLKAKFKNSNRNLKKKTELILVLQNTFFIIALAIE